ncbi:MAG: hypothetical protein HOP31_07350 [Ignavibacteria bacterium]|nr:hypothetical protein [Ignavibacteria bacterium]
MFNLTKNTYKFFLASILTGGLFIAGCGEDTIAPQGDNIEFSYVQSGDTVDNSGILLLDTVKILLKDIKLNVANSSDSSNSKVGPFVLYLDLNQVGGTNFIGSNLIPVGTYDKLNFEVHKLGDTETPPDPEFLDANGRYSVVVKGSYNGVRFIYKSDKSAKQKLTFPNSLVVTETSTNVTLRILPYLWFVNAATNEYMDPTDPANDGEIENNIKDNIKANFKAFKDADKNGQPD